MSIDDAIKHCKEVIATCNNKNCSEDHQQLLEWLTELKSLKNEKN